MSLAVSSERKRIDEHTIDKKIGNQVRRRRSISGMSQERLGEKVDVSLTTISRLENGRQMVSVAKLVKISEALQIEAGSLLSDFDFCNPNSKNEVDTRIALLLERCSIREKNYLLDVLELYVKYHQIK